MHEILGTLYGLPSSVIELELVQNVTDWTNKNHCWDPYKGIVYIDFEATLVNIN